MYSTTSRNMRLASGTMDHRTKTGYNTRAPAVPIDIENIPICQMIKKVNLPLPADIYRLCPRSREDSFVVKFKKRTFALFRTKSKAHFYRTILATAGDIKLLIIYVGQEKKLQRSRKETRRKGYCFQLDSASSIRILKGRMTSAVSNYISQNEHRCLLEIQFGFGTVVLELDGEKRISEWCPLFLNAFESTLVPQAWQILRASSFNQPSTKQSPKQTIEENSAPSTFVCPALPTVTAIELAVSISVIEHGATYQTDEKSGEDEEDKSEDNWSREGKTTESEKTTSVAQAHKKKAVKNLQRTLDRGYRRKGKKRHSKEDKRKGRHMENKHKKKSKYTANEISEEVEERKKDDKQEEKVIKNKEGRRETYFSQRSISEENTSLMEDDEDMLSSATEIGAPLASSSLVEPSEEHPHCMTKKNKNVSTSSDAAEEWTTGSSASSSSFSISIPTMLPTKGHQKRFKWTPKNPAINRQRRQTVVLNGEEDSMAVVQSQSRFAQGISRSANKNIYQDKQCEDDVCCTEHLDPEVISPKRREFARKPKSPQANNQIQNQTAEVSPFRADGNDRVKQVRWKSPQKNFVPKPYQLPIQHTSSIGYIVQQYGFSSSNSGPPQIQLPRSIGTHEQLLNVKRLFEQRIAAYMQEKSQASSTSSTLKVNQPQQYHQLMKENNKQGPAGLGPKKVATMALPPPPPLLNKYGNRLRGRVQEPSESNA